MPRILIACRSAAFVGMLFYPFHTAAEQLNVKFGGAGWSQVGRVESSTPSEDANDYRKNWLGSNGGLINATTRFDEYWEGGLGLGTVLVHLARGSKAEAENWYSFWIPFVSEARMTYTGRNFADRGGVQINLGYFPYNYNPDIKNLGAYLLRGYIYPGALISGNVFQGAPVADFNKIFGGMLSYKAGGFRNDFILTSETENKPLFDYSVANVLFYRMAPGFEIGAGINFYRLIPQNARATSPDKGCTQADVGPYAGLNAGQEHPCFIIRKDSSGTPIDTVTGSFAGTKAMARLRLDPMAWFGGPGALGANAFVLYGEAAIIGFKDYPVFYDDILRRIPVMAGVNLPGFNLLDLSLEIEYYASKNSSDNLPATQGSWLPAVDPSFNNSRDDWKWSVNASRMVTSNMLFAAQIANDHLRLGGSHNTATGIEATRTPKDWYWTCKLAYFF